jgi:hypothetical protein
MGRKLEDYDWRHGIAFEAGRLAACQGFQERSEYWEGTKPAHIGTKIRTWKAISGPGLEGAQAAEDCDVKTSEAAEAHPNCFCVE